MAEVFQGTVDIQDDAGTNVVITLNGNNGNARLGGNGQAGDVVVRDAAGNERVRIEAQAAISPSSAMPGQRW